MGKKVCVLVSVLVALVLLTAAVEARASPAQPENRVHLESNSALDVPSHVELLPFVTLTPAHSLSFVLAIKQRNLDQLERLLKEVSDPRHPRYGKYLSVEELTELISPSEDSLEAVVSWLWSNGVHDIEVTQNRDFLHATASATTVAELLQTPLRFYKHKETGKVTIQSTGPYTVPASVAPHIDFISGVVGFPGLKPKAPLAANSDGAIGPQDLRTRYGIDDIGSTNSTVSQAVAEFQAQYYNSKDLSQFFKSYVPNAKSGWDVVTKVIGDNNENQVGIEAALDIQYIMGVAPGVPTWFISYASFDFWADLTQWVSVLSNTSDIPPVHSVSYGDQNGFGQPSKAYKQRLDAEFQKLGARGISIIFASGDSGTGCKLCWSFEASFPATSPYVTSVGATRFSNGKSGQEEATTAFRSGGGFSNTFPIPDYQKDVVQHFFSTAKNLPASHYYNANGRGTPDVAALGVGYSVVVNGGIQQVGGTSASAPTFAGLISLLNQRRQAQGKPTLGFLNPWLYQTAAAHPEAFYDVVVGTNPGGGCCFKGFTCQAGWDPVTGLGTPNYQVLKNLV